MWFGEAFPETLTLCWEAGLEQPEKVGAAQDRWHSGLTMTLLEPLEPRALAQSASPLREPLLNQTMAFLSLGLETLVT